MLGILPRPVVNLLRRPEHRFVTARRAHHGRRQEVDHVEITAIGRSSVAMVPCSAMMPANTNNAGCTLSRNAWVTSSTANGTVSNPSRSRITLSMPTL